MIKYHLLELAARSRRDALVAWLEANDRSITGVHRLHFDDAPFESWFDALISELCASGALHVRDGVRRRRLTASAPASAAPRRQPRSNSPPMIILRTSVVPAPISSSLVERYSRLISDSQI